MKSDDGESRCGHAVTQLTYFRIAALVVAALTGAYAEEGAGPISGNPLWEVSLADLRTTVERPLFSPSRHAPEPPLAAPPVVAAALPSPRPSEPERPPLMLLGTITGARTEIAVLLDETTKDVVHLRVGQDRAGWTLRAVHGRQVDFERNRRVATLSLKRDGGDQPSAKPTVDVAVSSNPDMESYRAALNRMRGR